MYLQYLFIPPPSPVMANIHSILASKSCCVYLYYTQDVCLPTQFRFNFGPVSLPIAGSMPTNQGRIQDLKKEGCTGFGGSLPRFFLANLGDFLKNLAQKGVGVRPLRSPPLWIRACKLSTTLAQHYSNTGSAVYLAAAP